MSFSSLSKFKQYTATHAVDILNSLTVKDKQSL